MKSIYLIAIILIAISSCDELNRTQSEPPTIKILNSEGESLDALEANGADRATIEIKFDKLTFRNEEVIITTTNGSLFELSETDFDTTVRSLTITPFSKTAEVLLVAGNTPDKDVLITVNVGNQWASETMEFTF